MSRTLKVSSSAVAKTINRHDETGSHEDCQRKGRPRVASAAEDKFIRTTAPQIAAQINASQSSSNRHISTSTVQRRLHEPSLYSWIAAKKPLLKDTNNNKRLAWAKKHEQWILDQWNLSVGLMSPNLRSLVPTAVSFVRRRVGERMISACVVPTEKHGGGGVGVL